MKVEYKLSEKALQAAILSGQEVSYYQVLEFKASELSERARQLWVQLFGSATCVMLRLPKIVGGNIYEDGSVSSEAPSIVGSEVYEVDKILTPADLEAVLQVIADKRKELELQLPALREQWQEARKIYEQRMAKQKAEAEAEAQRRANIPWVLQLKEKLSINIEVEKEIQRFCQKFNLTNRDITTLRIKNKPYVRITATIPINVADIERELKITNQTFKDVADNLSDEWKKPEFSDFSQEVAAALAEIFKGKVNVVCDYERGVGWLTVETGEDTIEVASCELERKDY